MSKCPIRQVRILAVTGWGFGIAGLLDCGIH